MTPRVVMTKTPFAEALDELHFAATEQYARSRVRAASGTPFNRSAALRDIETAVRAANVGWQRRGNQLPAAKLAKITRKLCGDIRRLQRAYQGAISRPFLLEQIVPSGGTSVAEFENEAKQVADILKRHEQQLRLAQKTAAKASTRGSRKGYRIPDGYLLAELVEVYEDNTGFRPTCSRYSRYVDSPFIRFFMAVARASRFPIRSKESFRVHRQKPVAM